VNIRRSKKPERGKEKNRIDSIALYPGRKKKGGKGGKKTRGESRSPSYSKSTEGEKEKREGEVAYDYSLILE